MLQKENEIFSTIALMSIFFVMLIAIIIITAILYYNRKKLHREEVKNFQNMLLQTQWEIKERTMQTIGADLHDNVGQLLSLTSLTLNSIDVKNEIKTLQKIADATDLIKDSIKEMRLLGKLLQGNQLVKNGLIDAINYEIGWLEKTGKFTVIFNYEDKVRSFSDLDKDLVIFRIFQELINNIIKHSEATVVNVEIKIAFGNIIMNVIDNGKGFDTDDHTINSGMGLQNIQTRSALVGGTVKIHAGPGNGTSAELIIPYA